jgi:hypothetical protein
MKNDQDDQYDEITSSEDLIDPDLEKEDEEARQEYEESEIRPRLTLVKPTDQDTDTDLSDEDPLGWPEF